MLPTRNDNWCVNWSFQIDWVILDRHCLWGWGWGSPDGLWSEWLCGLVWVPPYVFFFFFFFFRRLLLFLPRTWVGFIVGRCVVMCFHVSCRLQTWFNFQKVFSTLGSNYQPISITPVLLKVFKRFIFSHSGRFLERLGVLPSHPCLYSENLGTCDALLDIISICQMEFYRRG